jgi:protein SCO1/2
MKTIVCILFTIFISCKDHHHDHKHHALPAGQSTDGSIFELEDVWQTQDAKTFQWKNLKGEPFLISMFYASCQAVCPRIVTDMQNISQKIQKKQGKVPKMILVSFDPSKDTPDILKAYAKKMELGDNWFLLNGKDDSVRTLSVLLGISYQKTTGNDFNHSTVISLVSGDGKISTRIEGLGADANTIVEKFGKD